MTCISRDDEKTTPPSLRASAMASLSLSFPHGHYYTDIERGDDRATRSVLLACSLIALPENFARCDGGSQQQGVRDMEFLPASVRKCGPISSWL